MKNTFIKLYPILATVLIIVLLSIILYPNFLGRLSNKSIINSSNSDQKDIITGFIEKKEINKLIVKGSLASKTNSDPLSMEILFDINTKITFLNQLKIPYLFKDPTIVSTIPSIHDINIGQSVYIYGSFDQKNRSLFKAEKIEIVNPPQIAIKGEIVNILDNMLVIDGAPYPPESVAGNQIQPIIKYSVYSQNETEISHIIPVSATEPNKIPAKVKLNYSDLKKNMKVVVYTNVYVAGIQSFTAFRIEPVIETTPSPSVIIN